MSEINDKQRNKGIYRNVSFFKTSPKLSYTFQGIHHYIVKLWNYCAYSIIHCWHNANLATGCRKTIWALNQNGTKVWVKVQYFVILYHNIICFICINHVYLKLKTKALLISLNTIYTCKADFWKGYQTARYYISGHSFILLCFSTQIVVGRPIANFAWWQ